MKGVGAGKLNLARGRRDCVETDRALHFVYYLVVRLFQ
jgi:hypothetical protein